MVGLASVKILHELSPSKQCSTKCTFLKEDKYFFFLPDVASLFFVL